MGMTISNNRVRESTTGIGTGDLDFGGPVSGHQAFSSIPGIAHGAYLCYALVASNGQWEVGNGMYLVSFGSGNPRISRTTPLEGSAGAGVLVDFAASPECFLTFPADGAITYGHAGLIYVGADQAIAAATPTVVQFNTAEYNTHGFAGASSLWLTGSYSKNAFNQQGIYNFRAKVDAVATFAGDSYLSIYKEGVEYLRGPTVTDGKSLMVDGDVNMITSDDVDIRIYSTTGGTIQSGRARSYVCSRWVRKAP